MYWVLKHTVGALLWVVYRPRVQGKEHIPATGAAILASNHLSFSDHFFLPLVLPRRVTFIAKSEYFTGSGVKGRLTAFFFRSMGQVPVDRSGGRAAQNALVQGLSVLQSGELLGIYPEGTRSPDGRLYRGKTGPARMAVQAQVPIIPVAMLGTDVVQPIGKRIPRLGRIGIRIGTPIMPPAQADHAEHRQLTDIVMRCIADLSGQDYVDHYAQRKDGRGQ